jgi:flagellar basal body rod protein FlgG
VLGIAERGLEAAEECVCNLMQDTVNAKTPGYRKGELVTRAFPLELEVAEKRISARFGAMQPQIEGKYINNLMGALERTGNDCDFAIGGDGFFVVLTPYGEEYTRDGRFYVNKDGQLVSVSGNFPLVTNNGVVIVPPGSQVVVSSSGEIKIDKQVVGKIRVVQPQNLQALTTDNGVVFRDTKGLAQMEDVASPRIIQGFVESSNVSTVDTMMDIILLNRLVNLNTKITQTRDAGLGRALELGRPAQ